MNNTIKEMILYSQEMELKKKAAGVTQRIISKVVHGIIPKKVPKYNTLNYNPFNRQVVGGRALKYPIGRVVTDNEIMAIRQGLEEAYPGAIIKISNHFYQSYFVQEYLWVTVQYKGA